MLIKNARVVTEGNEYEIKDILISQGKIEKIGTNLSRDKVEVLDLEGKKYLMPGMIDPHVHMREPGLTWKEDFESGSKSCLKGGVTTIIDMPNTNPVTSSLEKVEGKLEIAREKSYVNYGVNFGGTNNYKGEEIPNHKVASTKIFFNTSTGKLLVEDDKAIIELFKNSKLVSVHAEGETLEKVLSYNKNYGKEIYLCHISTRKELEIIKKYKEKLPEGKKIFVEVTPHHLFLSEDDREKDEESQKLLRMKPELKSKDDILALWEGIKNNEVDTIGSDHAPHLLSEKLEKTIFGIPGVETSYPLMLDSVKKGRITLQRCEELVAEKSSDIFKIIGRGRIKEGYYADLVVVDLEKNTEIVNDEVVSRCGWSPFHGNNLLGCIEKTLINGVVAYEDGKIIKKNSMEVEYDR